MVATPNQQPDLSPPSLHPPPRPRLLTYIASIGPLNDLRLTPLQLRQHLRYSTAGQLGIIPDSTAPPWYAHTLTGKLDRFDRIIRTLQLLPRTHAQRERISTNTQVIPSHQQTPPLRYGAFYSQPYPFVSIHRNRGLSRRHLCAGQHTPLQQLTLRRQWFSLSRPRLLGNVIQHFQRRNSCIVQIQQTAATARVVEHAQIRKQ